MTKKYYPPDSTALKTYLELSAGRGTDTLSDEELLAEKERLLAELAAAEKSGKQKNGASARRQPGARGKKGEHND